MPATFKDIISGAGVIPIFPGSSLEAKIDCNSALYAASNIMHPARPAAGWPTNVSVLKMGLVAIRVGKSTNLTKFDKWPPMTLGNCRTEEADYK
jgi:hypothetical protein